jgi:hypothetical protein
VLIDGTPFRDRQRIVALGISTDGRKTVLGLREGATENAAVSVSCCGTWRRAGWTSAYRGYACRTEARRWLRRCAVMPAKPR